MNLKEKIQQAWINRNQIAEGFYNSYLSHNEEIKEEAARRLSLCRENVCGFWDETGTNPRIAVKNKPGCILCGCNGKLKTSCMSCECPLQAVGETPRWTAVMTLEQEQEIEKIKQQQ